MLSSISIGTDPIVGLLIRYFCDSVIELVGYVAGGRSSKLSHHRLIEEVQKFRREGLGCMGVAYLDVKYVAMVIIRIRFDS